MIIYNAVVVVVVVPHPPAVTHVRRSNCLDICHSKLALVLQPICLLGIAIFYIFSTNTDDIDAKSVPVVVAVIIM